MSLTSTSFALLQEHSEHVEQCARWAFGAWGRYNPHASLQQRLDAFTRHCNKNALPLTWLAFKNGIPVGMASLRENDGIRSDLTPWLGSLYVAEEHRSYGIGKELIEHVKKHAGALGYNEVFLLTYEASLPAWYASLGWENIGTDRLFNNDVWVMKTKLQLTPGI